MIKLEKAMKMTTKKQHQKNLEKVFAAVQAAATEIAKLEGRETTLTIEAIEPKSAENRGIYVCAFDESAEGLNSEDFWTFKGVRVLQEELWKFFPKMAFERIGEDTLSQQVEESNLDGIYGPEWDDFLRVTIAPQGEPKIAFLKKSLGEAVAVKGLGKLMTINASFKRIVRHISLRTGKSLTETKRELRERLKMTSSEFERGMWCDDKQTPFYFFRECVYYAQFAPGTEVEIPENAKMSIKAARRAGMTVTEKPCGR